MTRRPRTGFTLIELLIVTVIIGILAAIAVPKWQTTKGKANTAALKSDLRNLTVAQESFFYENQSYTTDPNALMEPIHNRMPVILDERDEARWLDPNAPLDALCGLLEPCPPEHLEAFPVNRAMGNVAFQGPECLERVPPPKPPAAAPLRLPF